jgi:hypothetical protein
MCLDINGQIQRKSWAKAKNNFKRRVLMSISNSAVQRKLGLGQTIKPICLRRRTKTSQNLLNTSMVTLSKAICLRVITSAHSNSTLQLSTKRLPKGRLELHISITNDLTGNTKSTQPMIKEQLSNI